MYDFNYEEFELFNNDPSFRRCVDLGFCHGLSKEQALSKYAIFASGQLKANFDEKVQQAMNQTQATMTIDRNQLSVSQVDELLFAFKGNEK